ncbi:hypothetical protein J2741_000662 [Methanolinea mesophila]|uniref:hypothetical protein n=1 Tax=Methanolinea mesophila TaxID=547055 RepID=UPI001AE51256|nr:hypothetical protein [Methanolinea mesophila]MBP1928115.1 hypothetical protein [Methanolinea mesophila]
MGSSEDVMHDFARRAVKNKYPTVDGWQYRHAEDIRGKEMFVVSRRILGRSEGAYVLVSFDKKIPASDAGLMDSMSASHPIPGVARPDKVLIVAGGSDSSVLPEDIRILHLQGFHFEGKDLIWKKRNALTTEVETS